MMIHHVAWQQFFLRYLSLLSKFSYRGCEAICMNYLDRFHKIVEEKVKVDKTKKGKRQSSTQATVSIETEEKVVKIC